MATRRIDFSRYSSLKIGPVVDVEVIDSLDTFVKEESFIVGGANNLLLSPSPRPLAMLSKRFDYIFLEGDRLRIGGATKSGRIFSFAKKHNLKGFEYLSKLPGTLGGLVYMNAGMKEDEIFNSLLFVKTVQGEKPKEEIVHGYRFTNIEETIFEATFLVERGFDTNKVALFSHMRANQPKEPSAGSVFKNPKGEYAGRLIEAVGLKGERRGDAAFSQLHANFLVNLGRASYEDAIFLIEEAERRVYESFGIVLEREIQVL